MHISSTVQQLMTDRLQRALDTLRYANVNDRQLVTEALRSLRIRDVELLHVSEDEYTFRTPDGRVKRVSFDERLDVRTELAPLVVAYAAHDAIQPLIQQWQKQTTPQLKREPAHWIAQFEQIASQLNEMTPTMSIYDVERQLQHVRQQFIPLQPYEWEWQAVFTLYRELTIGQYLIPILGERIETAQREHYAQWAAERLLEQFSDTIAQAAEQVLSFRTLFGIELFLEALPPLIARATMQTTYAFSIRLTIYELLWHDVLKEEALHVAEMERLRHSDFSEAPFFLSLFHIHRGEDVELSTLLHTINETTLTAAIAFARTAYEEEREDIVEHIANVLYDHIDIWIPRTLSTSETRKRLYVADAILFFSTRRHARESVFLQYPKESHDLLSDLFIEEGRFDEWLALHFAYGASTYMLEQQIDFMMEVSPTHAMQAMHQFVTSEIEQKTRTNYKVAVRWLKKMKRLANQIGKQRWWQTYVDTLREQYRRLRALQEEIDKGNIR